MAIPKKKLYERYLARLKPLLSVSPNNDITDIFASAKTSVLRMSRYESSAFDTSWIDKVEECVLDLGEIISNPHIITEETGNLTPIELAKKTKGESVQHLASHTQYIKSIEEDGSVIPSKIISFINDDFLYTYENRFIATLIRRLLLFIEKRYEFVQEYLPVLRRHRPGNISGCAVGDFPADQRGQSLRRLSEPVRENGAVRDFGKRGFRFFLRIMPGDLFRSPVEGAGGNHPFPLKSLFFPQRAENPPRLVQEDKIGPAGNHLKYQFAFALLAQIVPVPESENQNPFPARHLNLEQFRASQMFSEEHAESRRDVRVFPFFPRKVRGRF